MSRARDPFVFGPDLPEAELEGGRPLTAAGWLGGVVRATDTEAELEAELEARDRRRIAREAAELETAAERAALEAEAEQAHTAAEGPGA